MERLMFPVVVPSPSRGGTGFLCNSLPFKGRVRVGMGLWIGLNRYLVTNLNSNIIQHITLGMGEGIVAESPDVIISSGLGSCVALTLYDSRKKVGGMAHVMLPDSKAVRPSLPLNPLPQGEGRCERPFWFADTAINYLLSAILKKGTAMRNITAKAAGGACMFPSYEGGCKGIGELNIESIKRLLTALHIPIAGWDLGGNYGRSAEFFLETGRVLIKAIGREDKEI